MLVESFSVGCGDYNVYSIASIYFYNVSERFDLGIILLIS